MNQIKKHELGTIELGSRVYVSDPCYRVGTWCQALISIKQGKYHAFMNKADIDDWGRRVTDLWIAHEDYKDVMPCEQENVTLGVDSGSMGIYDKDYYEKYHNFKDGTYINSKENKESAEWYERQFNRRIAYDINGNKIEQYWDDKKMRYCTKQDQETADGVCLDNKCVITDSGLGDGCYPLYSFKNDNGEIVALRVSFFEEEKDV